jgi:cytochrome c oxidase subunit III
MSDGSPLISRSTERGREPSFSASTAQLGIFVLFASLTMLFAAGLAAYLITSMKADRWVPLKVPHLWLGLGIASVLLIATTLVLHRALAAVRHNSFARLEGALLSSLALVLAFLGLQTRNWLALAHTEGRAGFHSLASVSFYLVTVLHALHVVAGLVPLSITILRARRKEYTSSRHEGLLHCVQYWDFLLVVWFVLLATIYLRS